VAVDAPTSRLRAKVMLTLETPQTLADLRTFMAQSVTLGMPDSSRVETETVPRNSIILSSPLDALGSD
jgi:hypothetical protein